MRLNISVPHRLLKEEVLKRIQEFSKHLKSQFSGRVTNLEEKWEGNIGNFHFLAKGHPITGTLIVNPSQVELNLDLPFAARFFKDRIEKAIREKANELLGGDTIKRPLPLDARATLFSQPDRPFVFNFVLFCTSIWLFLWLCSEILPRQIGEEKQLRKISKEDAKRAVKVLFGF